MGFLVASLIRRTFVGKQSYFNLTRSKNGKKKHGHWYLDGERVYISCPFCGVFYDISAHEIRLDGIVRPCIPCDGGDRVDGHRVGGCGRYLHVILKKWDLGYRSEQTFPWGR